MKNYFSVILKMITALFLVVLMVIFTACEGPQGPEGPAGKDGANGNGTCLDCHNSSTELLAKIMQYDNSVHATGGNFARSSKECAPCHTNEGFIERIASGGQETAADIENPTPPNCRTCHRIHTTFTENDLQLRTKEPVTLWINNKTIDLGEGNLCANCHQPRVPDPMPTIGGPDVEITSPYWGFHHGPQAAILTGQGGFEIAGSSEYKNSAHSLIVKNACVTCHMQNPYGDQAGGHSLNMTYESHGSEKDYTTICQKCHGSGVKDFDINGTQTKVKDLLSQLKAKLVEKGIVDDAKDQIIPGTYSSLLAGAYLNYKMVQEDKSNGVHNAKYTLALLNNTIEAIK